MKTIVFFVAFGLTIISTLCCNNSQTKMPNKQLSSEKLADKQPSDEQVINLLKSFYIEYITELGAGSPDFEKLKAMRRKYCTTSLLRRMYKLDYDPIVDAQDANIGWLHTLKVEKDSQNCSWYKASYVDTYDGTKKVIELKIVRDGEMYKIDTIR
ncbi:MAG TPA: hypothetical protein VMF29_09095 [Candidatus Edwardsbacteria bacterium]|nr:hypothetical protein [Candidatus Edwardsbacteria bacterium]